MSSLLDRILALFGLARAEPAVSATPEPAQGVPVHVVGDTNPAAVPASCVALVAQYEGFRSRPYLCPAGVPTIGYGTTVYPGGRRVTLSDPSCTEAQARVWLAHDLAEAARAVDSMVTVPLTQSQRGALISWVYNIGATAARKSTLVRKLNAGDYAAVSDELARWNQAGGRVLPGLVKRRAAEAALWRSTTA